MKILRTRARIRRPRPGAGFNLLELMVVMAIVMILAVLVIPEFRHLLRRYKLDGAVQGVAQVVAQARAEAIRRGVPVVVRADVSQNALVAFADVNAVTPKKGSSPPDYVHALVFDPNDEIPDLDPVPAVAELPQGATDYQVAFYPLPGGNLSDNAVQFWGAEDDAPGGLNVTTGFTTDPDGNQVAVFLANGSIRDVGGFRIAMGAPRDGGVTPDTDEFRNFFEIFIEPQATAKVNVRKWAPKQFLTRIGLTTVDSAYLEKFKYDGKWTWSWF